MQPVTLRTWLDITFGARHGARFARDIDPGALSDVITDIDVIDWHPLLWRVELGFFGPVRIGLSPGGQSCGHGATPPRLTLWGD